MIFVTKDILNSKEKLLSLFEKEKQHMKSYLNFQHQLKDLVLFFMQKSASSTDDGTENCLNIILNYLENLKNSLNVVKENISMIENDLDYIDDIVANITNNDSIFDINNFDLDRLNIEDVILNNTMKVCGFLYSILKFINLDFSDNNKSEDNEQAPDAVDNVDKLAEIKAEITNIDNDKYKENTLLISELKGIVILPYKITELNEILNSNPEKYFSIDDVIDKLYTVPFSTYKNPSIARFREAFKLVHSKEHGSIKSAFDLGMELLFNYNLHPAIITACKNLDELDIYLDYLESGEIDKFDLFKTVFEVSPVIVPVGLKKRI